VADQPDPAKESAMADDSVPGPSQEAKEPRPGEPEICEAWLACLNEAIQLRTEQRFQVRLKTGSELRQSAREIGPLAGEFGVESPVFFRALAALITLGHPLVLLAALAGLDPPTARRQTRAPAAVRRRARSGRW
jgi:hypothetical protein